MIADEPGHMGVMIQEVNQDLANSFGLEKPGGALVSSVEKDSPAERAGIESGDVIQKFNCKETLPLKGRELHSHSQIRMTAA